MKLIITALLVMLPGLSFAQYDDYQSYQTFTDLDNDQLDWGLVFLPSLMYNILEDTNQVTGQPSTDFGGTSLFYDVKLAYIFRGGFSFGLLFAGETQDFISGGPSLSRESVGISFGYFKRNWHFNATLFPYSKQSISNVIDIEEYSDGLGFQLDVAYYFRVGRYFSLGPQLVYKSINYSEAEDVVGNQDYDADSNHTRLIPMISLMFNLYRG